MIVAAVVAVVPVVVVFVAVVYVSVGRLVRPSIIP